MSNQSQNHEGHLTVVYSPEKQRDTLLDLAGRNIDESVAVNYGMHFRNMAAANQPRNLDADSDFAMVRTVTKPRKDFDGGCVTIAT